MELTKEGSHAEHPLMNGLAANCGSPNAIPEAQYDFRIGAWLLEEGHLAIGSPDFSGVPTKKKDAETGEDEK